MKDLLANPDVQQLVRYWRRHSRGARLVQEYFDHDPALALDFLNSQLRFSDFERDMAQEPAEFRREVASYVQTLYGPTKGDC
jgi:hypothetical protein